VKRGVVGIGVTLGATPSKALIVKGLSVIVKVMV